MRRRELITLLSGLATWPVMAWAQQSTMAVIGLLTVRNPELDELRSIEKGFKEGGYVEGRNLAVVFRSADPT